LSQANNGKKFLWKYSTQEQDLIISGSPHRIYQPETGITSNLNYEVEKHSWEIYREPGDIQPGDTSSAAFIK